MAIIDKPLWPMSLWLLTQLVVTAVYSSPSGPAHQPASLCLYWLQLSWAVLELWRVPVAAESCIFQIYSLSVIIVLIHTAWYIAYLWLLYWDNTACKQCCAWCHVPSTIYSGTSENGLFLLWKPPQCGQESAVPNYIIYVHKETSLLRTPLK